MKRLVVIAAVVAGLALAVALPYFEPWRLFTSSTADEPVPSGTPVTSATPDVVDPSPVAETLVVATGDFVHGEHGTSGTARILQLADGRRFLRLERLASSDGPDLHVWLSDARSGGDWGSYDDGAYLRLGNLKATHGNQNYVIPAEADLSRMRSVVIWCDRFNVAFGTAPIRVG